MLAVAVMMKLVALGLLAAQCVTGLRFAMYIDEYHTANLPGTDRTQEIDYAIMAFAPSTLFNSASTPSFTPFEPVSTMRKRFGPNTKVMMAIGGWGDTSGFSAGVKDNTTRALFAKNVAAVLDANGFDGVDIDWEYPGGNGQDYKQIPNSAKVSEIAAFPPFLQAIRSAIGNKTLSVAVPGKKVDMIAFTPEQGPKIWPSVDMVNVMTYDLMNRRDNVTNFHTSVQGSLDTVNNYIAIGLDPAKMNLGFAYYAKWFTTDPKSDCSTHPIGCAVVPLENPDGSDNGKSGAWTFTKGNMAPAPTNLTVSTNGKCGLEEGTKCPSGSCCSQYGNCGTAADFCQTGCQSDYGTCKGISLSDLWHRAESNGKTDQTAGGQYYWDNQTNLFWTWDTPALIARKFTDIIAAKKLGGVMAWSLGEDTYDWSHLKAMQNGTSSAAA